jgi:spermidine/putrescine transport system ATP-binding protein
MPTTETLLSIKNVDKFYGKSHALRDVSFDVKAGEFVAMLGPSGCGKTTLLRCISGFVTPEGGSISIAGQEVTGLPPNRRPLNTVFQNYALFPHMNVLENVAFGPRRAGMQKPAAREQAMEMLQLVGLAEHSAKFPQQLSGGQQQRVALARALVNRPKLLLLDEPLSALDMKLRKRMQLELKHLQEKLGIAFVFVTHDQEEAMAMADTIIVMNAGRVEQLGPGRDIYRAPNTRFVADFVGEANFVDCKPDGGDFLVPAVGSEPIPFMLNGRGSRFTAVLRPEQISLLEGGGAGMSIAAGTVEDFIDLGRFSTVRVRVGDQVLACRAANGTKAPERGQAVTVAFRTSDIHVIAEE